MTHEEDALINQQWESIQNEIKDSQKLTSELLSLEQDLLNQYDPSSNFAAGCKYLCSKYKYYRSVRRDGNCYYRAFLFALCEYLLHRPDKISTFQDFARSSIEQVTQYGYERFTVEAFQEELMDLFDYVATLPTIEQLQFKLNQENSCSDYCCWYLRCVTSSYIQKDPIRFIPFLDDMPYADVKTFCEREVDPMGRESGQVQVLALAEAFGVRVNIEYLDGRDAHSCGLIMHSFGPQQEDVAEICLLYRPGHYDILNR